MVYPFSTCEREICCCCSDLSPVVDLIGSSGLASCSRPGQFVRASENTCPSLHPSISPTTGHPSPWDPISDRRNMLLHRSVRPSLLTTMPGEGTVTVASRSMSPTSFPEERLRAVSSALETVPERCAHEVFCASAAVHLSLRYLWEQSMQDTRTVLPRRSQAVETEQRQRLLRQPDARSGGTRTAARSCGTKRRRWSRCARDTVE